MRMMVYFAPAISLQEIVLYVVEIAIVGCYFLAALQVVNVGMLALTNHFKIAL